MKNSNSKILLFALAAKFPTIDVDALLEVVEATPNPIVATEKLLGVYEHPIIPPLVKRKTKSGEVYMQMYDYDSFENRVKFEYEDEDTEYLSYPKSLEEELLGKNYHYAKKVVEAYNSDGKESTSSRYFPMGVTKIRKDTYSLADWLKLEEVEEAVFYARDESEVEYKEFVKEGMSPIVFKA